MKFTWILTAAPFALVLLTGGTSNVWAQAAGPGTPRTQPRTQPPANGQPANRPIVQTAGQTPAGQAIAVKPQRPAATNLVVQQLSPEFEKILIEWEKESAKIKTLDGKHTRIVYNLVFEVEKLSQGRFFLEMPDKGRIDLVGFKPKTSEEAVRFKKQTAGGGFYDLAADRAEKWICDGNFVYSVNDEEKTYEEVEIPEKDRGTNIVNSPLPFLFGMKVADMKNRYRLELKTKEKDLPTAKILTISAEPREQRDRLNYSLALIMLDRKRFLPTAVKLQDPDGNQETVYIFEDVKVNESGWKKSIKETFGMDPFNPPPKSYRKIMPKLDELDEPGPRITVDTRTRPSQARPNPQQATQPNQSTSNRR